MLIFACEGWKLVHRYDPQGKSGQLCQWPSASTVRPLTLVYHLARRLSQTGLGATARHRQISTRDQPVGRGRTAASSWVVRDSSEASRAV